MLLHQHWPRFQPHLLMRFWMFYAGNCYHLQVKYLFWFDSNRIQILRSISILTYIAFVLFSVCIDRTSDNFVLPSSEDVPGLNESGEGIQNSVALADSILNRSSYASYSASAILMMVFQFVTDNSAIQRKVTECLMALKDDLVKVINRVWFASLFNIKYDELLCTNKCMAI